MHENSEMKELIGKGKHTEKIGNHPHTKLLERLKDKNHKNHLYPQ